MASFAAMLLHMGTWDDGLYDNDSALDLLGDIFNQLDPTSSPAHLAATVGLFAQMNPSMLQSQGWDAKILSSPHLKTLPADAQATLHAIAENPEQATSESSRPAAHLEALGAYLDGPRFTSLFTVQGADVVVREFVEHASSLLDRINSRSGDLYECAALFSPLGIILDSGLKISVERIAGWESVFEAANAATDEERGFWDGHVVRVRKAFAILRARN